MPLREPIELRLGRKEDREFIVELATATFAALGDYRATMSSWLDAAEVGAVVATEAGHRRGFALVAVRQEIGFGRRPTAELLAIAIAPTQRRRGIGRMLLERAELLARGFSASEMRLHTAASNARAQRFFTAAGYQRTRERAAAYPSGEQALAMVKALG